IDGRENRTGGQNDHHRDGGADHYGDRRDGAETAAGLKRGALPASGTDRRGKGATVSMAGPDIRPRTAPRVRAIRNGRRACGRNIRARTALLLLLLAIAAAPWPSGAEAAASAPAAWPALLPAGLPGDGPATSVRLVDDAAGFSTGMPHEAAGFPAAGPTDDAAALPPEAERLEAHWTAIMNEYGDYFAPGARPPFRELVAPDGGSPKTADVLAGLMRFFFHDIVRHGRLLVSIVVLTVLSSVLQTLQGAFERQA